MRIALVWTSLVILPYVLGRLCRHLVISLGVPDILITGK